MRSFFFKLFLLIAVLVVSRETVAQVNWVKYSGNPVLTAGAVGAWNRHMFQPSVLYNPDSSRYEMWFAASIGPSVGWRPYKIGFANSIDGVVWKIHSDPVLNPGSTGSWDASTVEAPFVVRENGQYKMWYTGGSGKIGYATSPDGINWTKYSGNPIFGAGTQPWEAGGVYSGSVMPITGGYKMWYSGWTTSSNNESIGLATSVDGILWQRDTLHNPILKPGISGQWDYVGIYIPEVVVIENLYYMWYCGFGSFAQLGLATSTDGISWNKHSSNPVLRPTPGRWDDSNIEEGRVLLVGDTLYMWYGGSGGSGSNYLWNIGLAKSSFVPVPVELTSFTASALGNEVALNWTTATELNNYGFEIQRKALGREFATVAFVKGQGTTTQQNQYSFLDKNLDEGKYFYRLKQMDYGGQFSYSQIVEVDVRTLDNYTLEQNYPNPFNPTTTIGYVLQEKSNAKLTLLNSLGEEIAVLVNEEQDKGYHKVEYNASTLVSGVYFYQLRAGSFIETKKMMLLR
jgi:predicted GH43/DUF377 family glycosyl hydrolase